MIDIASKLAVYPSLIYAQMLELLGFRQWYTRIDKHVVLGALPLRRNYKQIISKENIQAILTLNQSHELEYSISKSEWISMGVDYKQIEIEDYIGVASLEQIKEAIEFINRHKGQEKSVYVHCKAGRYRSALIVGCYLINSCKFTPEQASEHLKLLRSFVIMDKPRQLNAMREYYNYLYNQK